MMRYIQWSAVMHAEQYERLKARVQSYLETDPSGVAEGRGQLRLWRSQGLTKNIDRRINRLTQWLANVKFEPAGEFPPIAVSWIDIEAIPHHISDKLQLPVDSLHREQLWHDIRDTLEDRDENGGVRWETTPRDLLHVVLDAFMWLADDPTIPPPR